MTDQVNTLLLCFTSSWLWHDNGYPCRLRWSVFKACQATTTALTVINWYFTPVCLPSACLFDALSQGPAFVDLSNLVFVCTTCSALQ